MLENIAIIKEVHELMSIDEAEDIAREELKKISLSQIALYRLTQCSPIEIFYVMLIRAIMAKEMNVIIVTPFLLVDNLSEIEIKIF